MVGSQAFQACILPAVAIPVFILLNRKAVVENHLPSNWLNIGMVGVIMFSLLTTYFAVVELFN